MTTYSSGIGPSVNPNPTNVFTSRGYAFEIELNTHGIVTIKGMTKIVKMTLKDFQKMIFDFYRKFHRNEKF